MLRSLFRVKLASHFAVMEAQAGTGRHSGFPGVWLWSRSLCQCRMAVLCDGQTRADRLDSTGGIGFYELETVAKGGFVSHQSPNGHRSCGKSKFKVDDVSDLNLEHEDGGNSRLTDINRVASQDARTPAIDANVHLQGKTGMDAGLGEDGRGAFSGLAVRVQVSNSP